MAFRGGSVSVPPSLVLALRAGLGPNVTMTSHRVVSRRDEQLPYPVLGAQRVSVLLRRDGEQAGEGAES